MLNEILQKIGIQEDTLFLGCKCTVLGNQGFYVEGIAKVLSFDSQNVALKTSNGQIVICGENLKIKSMSKNDVIIKGQILKVEFVK